MAYHSDYPPIDVKTDTISGGVPSGKIVVGADGKQYFVPDGDTTAFTRALSAQQMDALGKSYREAFQRAVDDIELRKIALQSAAALCEASMKQLGGETFEPLKLAREMHAFLSEPTAEITVKVG